MTTSTGAANASPESTTRTPRDVVDHVCRIVEGSGSIAFADLFASDGVLEYPFAPPGMPDRLEGREAVRDFYTNTASGARGLLEIEEVDATVYETTDPEVVIAEIKHHGMSHVTGEPYSAIAVGVIRIRDGQIVSYRDYMNPLNLARLMGQMPQLLAALG